MKNTRRAILLLSLPMFALPAAAAEPSLDAATLKLIPRRMQEFVDRGDISGVVTLVGRNGRIAALDAAGFADIGNKREMLPDSIVQIMSQTNEGDRRRRHDPGGSGPAGPHAPRTGLPAVWELMCHSSGLGFLPVRGEFACINYTRRPHP